MHDHDQRLKLLLREFFRQFLTLFLPERAELLDFDRVEWLEQEMFPDPPQGVRRQLDLVAKVPLKEPLKTSEVCAETIVIVHLEVESQDSVMELRRKMHAYYSHLRLKHPSEPIPPVAVYLKVGLNGLGVDSFTDQFLRLRDLAIQLLLHWVAGPRCGEVLERRRCVGGGAVGPDAIAQNRSRSAQARGPASSHRIRGERVPAILLAECIQAYLTLDEDEQEEFEQMIVKSEHREIKEKALTWFDQGFERGEEQGFSRGIEQGIEKGRREQAGRSIARRFGKSDERVAAWLRGWSDEQLDEAFDVIYRASSLDELLAAKPPSPN